MLRVNDGMLQNHHKGKSSSIFKRYIQQDSHMILAFSKGNNFPLTIAWYIENTLLPVNINQLS